MTIALTIHRAGRSLAAVVFAALLGGTAGPAAARADEQPITVFTNDPAPRQPDGPAGQLLQAARERGTIWVIAGLRTALRMEHTLTPPQVDAQRQSLRRMQDAVALRVVGAAGGDRVEPFDVIPYLALRVSAAQIERMLADPEIVSIEKDVSFQPELKESIPLIHADDVFAAGFDGTGQVVAIVDSGVDKTHPMLDGKVVSEACYSTNLLDDEITSLCPNGVTKSTKPGSALNCPVAINGCDHGTHVASIAAGRIATLNGVARGAKIIAVKVASKTGDNFMTIRVKDVVRGLERIYDLRDQYKIAAVNMSFGLQGGVQSANCDLKFPSLTTALANLRAAGIMPVKSAGNNGSNNAVTIPGCISTVTAVGNSNDNDVASNSSNHSPMVKLMAPGTRIKAALPGNLLGNKSGTSMAAPHVAGAFALLKDAKSAATIEDILAVLSCSGKTIDQRLDDGGNPVELDPPRPRIDLLGALNRLRLPHDNVRVWEFSSPDEARDWTPLRGTWTVQSGAYRPKLLLPGRVGASTANCYSNHLVIARIKRLDPSADPFLAWNSGIIVRANINHTAETVSGYWFAFNRLKNPETEQFGDVTVWLMQNWNLVTGDYTVSSLRCHLWFPIRVGGFNTLSVMSTGSTHAFSVNETEICAINDSTFATGAVMVAAAAPDPATGHVLTVDKVTIRSFDTAPAGAKLATPLMDPAAFRPRPTPPGVTPSSTRARRTGG